MDDLFAICNKRSDITLLAPDGITMSTITPGFSIASFTMQPDRRQIWIAESRRDPYAMDHPACRLQIYAYNGRRLGSRTLTGAKVLRAMPVEEDIARYLIQRYAAPAGQAGAP